MLPRLILSVAVTVAVLSIGEATQSAEDFADYIEVSANSSVFYNISFLLSIQPSPKNGKLKLPSARSSRHEKRGKISLFSLTLPRQSLSRPI